VIDQGNIFFSAQQRGGRMSGSARSLFPRQPVRVFYLFGHHILLASPSNSEHDRVDHFKRCQ
jgi:hypothetical protein